MDHNTLANAKFDFVLDDARRFAHGAITAKQFRETVNEYAHALARPLVKAQERKTGT